MSLGTEDLDEESAEDRAVRVKEAQAERMHIRNRVVNELFNEITPEERAKLDELIEDEKTAAANKTKDKGDERGHRRRANTRRVPAVGIFFACAIDESGEVFAKIHKTIGDQTGWYGFTVYGGPNPRFEGALSMKVVCFGETAAGNNFEAAHGSFDEGISKPFQAFLKRCFSSADRRARALVEKEDKTEAILPSLDGLFRLPSDEGASEAEPAEKQPKPKRVSKPKNKTKEKSSNQPALSAPPAPITPASTHNPEASDSLLPARPAEERAPSTISPTPDSEDFHFDTLTMPDDSDPLDSIFSTPTDFNVFNFSADDAYEDDASGGGMDFDSLLHEPTTPVRLGSSLTLSTSTRTTNVMGFNFSTIDSQFHTPQLPPSKIRGLFEEFREHVASSPIRGSAPFAPSPIQVSAPQDATQKVAPMPRMALTAPSAALSTFACAVGVPSPTSSSLIARSALVVPRVAVPSPFASVVARTTLPTPFASVVPRAAPSLFASLVPHTALPSPFASAVPRTAFPSPCASTVPRASVLPTPASSLLSVATFAPVPPRPAASSPFARATGMPAVATSSPLATIDEESENTTVPAPIHIRSRPMTKPPLVKKTKQAAKPKAAPVRKAVAKKAAKAAGKKPVGRPKGVSEVEGETGKAAGKRPVGRPRKSTTTPMNDVTNDANASAGAVAAAPSSSPAVQPLVFSMPGNNTLEYNRRKDAEIAANKAAVRAENARVFNPDGETPLIIVPPPPPSSDATGPRMRKPSAKALAMAPKQPTRAQQAAKRNAPSENALLARAGSKRGAVEVVEGEGSTKRPKAVTATRSKKKCKGRRRGGNIKVEEKRCVERERKGGGAWRGGQRWAQGRKGGASARQGGRRHVKGASGAQGRAQGRGVKGASGARGTTQCRRVNGTSGGQGRAQGGCKVGRKERRKAARRVNSASGGRKGRKRALKERRKAARRVNSASGGRKGRKRAQRRAQGWAQGGRKVGRKEGRKGRARKGGAQGRAQGPRKCNDLRVQVTNIYCGMHVVRPWRVLGSYNGVVGTWISLQVPERVDIDKAGDSLDQKSVSKC
ncbi:hypothetical protein B0H11DRAFT_2187577 [Mycena galericulata]|nr:hypothetical protein B0H11DRAFT_2187577 [Mycena galericulata]